MRKRKDLAKLMPVLAGWLLFVAPCSAIAALIEFGHGFPPDYGDVGWGYVTYDRSSSFDGYKEWWNLWARCELSGNFGPCGNLPDEFAFSLRIKEAALGFGGPGGLTNTGAFPRLEHARRPTLL